MRKKWLFESCRGVICAGALALLLAGGRLWAGEVDLFCTAVNATVAPVIDGVVGASEWAQARPQSGFTTPNSHNPAPVQTSFRVLRDSKYLYVAIVADEPLMARIKAGETHRDGDVASDDCVEIGIDPAHDHLTHYHFIVNPLGTLLDFRNGFYSAWNADAKVGVWRGSDEWSVEIAIPLKSLAAGKPRYGDVWGFNVYRERQAGGGTELTNWAESTGVFTVSRQMGHLVFGSPVFSFARAHRKFLGKLTAELARSPGGFEGRPWDFRDNELSEDHDLTSSLITGEPRAVRSRRPRALIFIGSRGEGRNMNPGTSVRDAVELLARFDCEASAVFLNSRGLVGEALGERRLRYLLQDKYDAFVFGRCDPGSLPGRYEAQIAERVQAGTGLVCVSDSGGRGWLKGQGALQQETEHFVPGIPIGELSAFKEMKDASGVLTGSSPVIASYTCGNGRAVSISYPSVNGLTPELALTPENVEEYGFWIDVAGQALDWALREEFPVKIEMSSQALNAEAVPGLFSFRVDRGAAEQASVAVSLLSAGETRKVEADRGADGRYRAHLPACRPGQYWLEAYATDLDGHQASELALGKLTVTPSASAPVVQLDRAAFNQGEAVTGTVTLIGGEALEIRIRNARQESVALVHMPAHPGENRFSIVAGDAVTRDMTLEVAALAGAKRLEAGSARFSVRLRPGDGFHGVMWDQPDGPMGLVAFENLREKAGFDVVLDGVPGRAALSAGYSGLPYTTRITNNRDANGIMNGGCWNDPEALRRRLETAVEKQRVNAANGVWRYSLGDENNTLGCCLHPACLAAYRTYLREQYGTIEALNRSWRESYRSFEEVQLLEGDDVFKSARAFQTGRYPRWLDRQKFARLNYARLCKRYGDAYRRMDPGAVTGFEGTGEFGEDPDALLASVGMWTTYNNTFDDILRTMIAPQFVHSIWTGYQKEAEPLLSASWRALALGADSYWWWRWDGIGFYRGFVRPTLDLWDATQAVADDMRVVRNGLGKLLMEASPVDDGVAILYSVESVLSDQIPSEQAYGRAEYAHAAFIHMLKDCGVGYRYVTPERIRAGALKGTRILILPHAFAIDARTAEIIRAFVKRGGTVLADQRPGVYDGHLGAAPRGMLEELFGAPGVWREGTAERRRYGQGRAVLLNASVVPYETNRDKPSVRSLRKEVLAECKAAGVKAGLTLTDVQGRSALMTEATRFRLANGGELVCLRRDSAGWEFTGPGPLPAPHDYPVRAHLKTPRYVYDLRNGRYLGLTDSFRCTLSGGRASFFGVFDKPVGQVSVMSQVTRTGKGTVIRAETLQRGPDTALVFRLLDARGVELGWARRVTATSGGKATEQWRLSSESPLPAQVQVNELFSNKTVQTRIGG